MSSEKENTYADAGNMPQMQIGPARLLHQPPGNQRAANLACLSKEMPQKLRAKEVASRRSSGETAGRSSRGLSQKHLGNATLPCLSFSVEMLQKQRGKVNAGLMPQKHRKEETMGTCSSSGVSHKHLRTPGVGLHKEMLQKQRKKVDTGSMPQNHRAKKMCPPDQLHRHSPSIQGAVNITKADIAREKHSRSSTSFPTNSATPQLRTRTSSHCSNSGTRHPVDGHDHGNTASQESRKSAAINIAKEADDAIQKLNELRRGEDIGFEEYHENTYAGTMPQTQIGAARLRRQSPSIQRAANLAGLSGEMPQKLRAKEAAGRRSSGETAGRRSSGGVSQKHLGKATLPGMSLSGEMLQKQMGKVNASLMPQKHREEETMGACYSSGVSHKHLGKVVSPGMGLHREMLPKQRKKKVDMGLMPQNQGAKEMMCPPDQLRRHPSSIQGAVNITRAGVAREKHNRSSTSFPRKSATPQLKTRSSSRCSNSGARRPVDGHDHGNTATQESRESAAINIAKEADDAIQKLNELRLGEDISFEEYRGYLMLLPWDPHVDTSAKMDCAERFLMKIRHAKYRIRSYKLSQKVSKNELHNTEMKVYCPMDLLDKEEFTPNFLMKMQFFTCLEDDGMLDWFFHSDLCMLAGLNDYQRLVPQNHGDCEYADWDEYRNYFHSHEMQREYVEYFKILLRELKWLEKCLHFKPSSRIGDIICTRGIYQATKIATGFSKITGSLAYIGFYECLNYISNETTWCEGSDGLYFEIWKRVTQQEKCFGSALEEVYLLNKFPLRQDSMKFALEDDCSFMKSEFHTCTAGITKEVSEDKAQELITETVKKLRTKPKFYDQYIRKKLDIAQSIGLISTD